MENESPGDDILKSVDPARRDFLRKIVAGTAFAVPLMASFSMEGLSVNAAEAACAYVPYSYCSETPYTGPTEFEVELFYLTGSHVGSKGGKWKGSVTDDGCTLIYRLTRENAVCHITLAQLFEFVSGQLASVQTQDVLGRAFDSLRSSLESKIPAAAGALGLASTRNGFFPIASQLSFPAAFLISAGGIVILSRRGILCSGPGFELTALLEALAAGEFFIFRIQENGIIGGPLP
jgi:hypothetical protein